MLHLYYFMFASFVLLIFYISLYIILYDGINVKLCVFSNVGTQESRIFFLFFQAYGNVSTQVFCEQKNQSSLVKSSDEISLSSATSDQLSCISFTSSSSTSLLTTDFPIPLSQHLLASEKNDTENKKFRIPFEIDVEDYSAEHTAQLEANFEKVVPKLDDKTLDLINVEAIDTIPFEENVQRTQSVTSQEDTEDPQLKNPLFILLQKNGLYCRELVNHPQRNDLVLDWRDINLIARIIAKHLLNSVIPPKRKILTSTLTR